MIAPLKLSLQMLHLRVAVHTLECLSKFVSFINFLEQNSQVGIVLSFDHWYLIIWFCSVWILWNLWSQVPHWWYFTPVQLFSWMSWLCLLSSTHPHLFLQVKSSSESSEFIEDFLFLHVCERNFFLSSIRHLHSWHLKKVISDLMLSNCPLTAFSSLCMCFSTDIVTLSPFSFLIVSVLITSMLLGLCLCWLLGITSCVLGNNDLVILSVFLIFWSILLVRSNTCFCDSLSWSYSSENRLLVNVPAFSSVMFNNVLSFSRSVRSSCVTSGPSSTNLSVKKA